MFKIRVVLVNKKPQIREQSFNQWEGGHMKVGIGMKITFQTSPRATLLSDYEQRSSDHEGPLKRALCTPPRPFHILFPKS